MLSHTDDLYGSNNPVVRSIHRIRRGVATQFPPALQRFSSIPLLAGRRLRAERYLVDLAYLNIPEAARTGVDRQGRNGYRLANSYNLDRVTDSERGLGGELRGNRCFRASKSYGFGGCSSVGTLLG
jgi:hypothetical protein